MAGQKVAIIGGGAIGSAVACFLLQDPAFAGEVTVIERDPTYARASSALSASSIRQQFSTAINIEIGQFGIEFLRGVGERLAVGGERPEIGLVEGGYLFLASAAGRATLEENHRIQKTLGADVALLDPAGLRARFPWISTEGIAAGSLGLSGEGWFDGYSLLQAYRRKARSLGATYIAAEARGFGRDGARISAVRLADGSTVPCDIAVNAAGPWAREPAAWLGIDLPVRARRRSVFVFTCPTPVEGAPLLIDPSGVYFRPEGRGFICGTSPDPARDPDDLPLDPEHELFEEVIWPVLARRVPAFEALRQTSAWAGYYELNTFDYNGIVGSHPQVPNLIFANGFSGHGLQQSPAVGRGVAELIAHGGYRTLDLSPLAFERIAANRPLLEKNVV
ncbi:MAG: FAD-binding oxidoreductase [Betaproteobacteria bacterium]|nr:FAD-binding oxidoreductase [Betaproteobacteria bacterium]